ncbi:MAG TPA: phenylalanine--tRNA ligase subunit beta [Opitutaceae bacterium]|nr:phenylalanine--tRNA ligase subunit beta [Opitutaceae bacterium]
MKLSLNWLRRYVALDRPVDEISHALTMIGFEVEGIHRTGLEPIANVVVGEIVTRDKHPGADKLSVCTVRVAPDATPVQIVCGAPNCDAGHRVPVALPGAVMPGDFKIKVSKIRGVESNGMMCSARELGLGEDHGGLLVLQGNPTLGTPIHEALGAGDVIFDLEITPNRPDCLSHLGLARELAAWFRLPLQYPAIKASSPAASAPAVPQLLESVAVAAEEDCPHYTAHVIAGVKIGPSPAWLQETLQAVGLRPINNVVDVTNFVLLETGQPLHAFDAKKIAGRRLIIRRAGDGEKLVTLDNKERTLNGRMLVIADAEKPLVVAGIMGGANAEVDATTTDLVLESAFFKPTGIRWTSKKLGLTSDSAYRFERGVDPRGVLPAALRAIDLILETAGGKVVGPLFNVGSEPVTVTEIETTPDFIRARAGYDIPDTAMRELLEALELEIEERADTTRLTGVTWTVKVPSWRGDLDRPVDLVEEVVRLYGCEKIPAAPVTAVALPEDDDPITEFNRAAVVYLVGQHFHECANYSQRSGPETAAWVSEAAAKTLGLANPFTEEYSHLRASLINGLLENLRLNQDRRTGATKLFEVGRTFREVDGKIYECLSVGFVIRTESEEAQWLARAPGDFYTAKRHLGVVAANAGVNLESLRVEPVAATSAGWQPGHSATFGRLTDGCEARCGLLNLEMLRKLGIASGVVAGILYVLPEKVAEAQPRAKFKGFSLFPPALRDIALVVDSGSAAETVRRDVAKAARAATGGKLALENVRLFDVYQGKGLPEGKKSLAFSLVYRADDRTLTDDEVNAAFQKTQDELAKNAAYAIRK